MSDLSRILRVVLGMGRLAAPLLWAAAVLGGLAFGTGVARASGGFGIVAHQRDDFLFMNPDLQNQISQGLQTVTVYLNCFPLSSAPGLKFSHSRNGELAARGEADWIG